MTMMLTHNTAVGSRQLSHSRTARQQHLAALPPRFVVAVKQAAGSSPLRQHSCCASSTPPSTGSQRQGGQQEPADEDFEGLLPEEDVEVPGTYLDALSSSTKLGKAVKAAVEELEHLGNLEAEVLQECDDLLRKLGMQGSLFGSSSDNPLLRLQQELQQQQELEEEEQQQQQQQKQKQP